MGETSMEVGAMPKETILSAHHASHAPQIKCADLCEVKLHVTWGRGGRDVRIATVNPTAGEEFDPASGWWADLDREGINRLIWLLRKARDQAFGADA